MENKITKILVPVIAVVVIFESVILVSNLEKNTVSNTVSTVTPTVTVTEPAKKNNAFDLALSADKTQMELGKKYKVTVKLTPKDSYNLNALSLYVRYNTALMTISNLTSTKDLPTPDLLKVSDKKNVVAMEYLSTDKNGMAFTKDKEMDLLTFTVTPKVANSAYFEVSTGDTDGNSVTMFVDKNTSEDLPFSSNRLEIELIK